MLVNIDSMKPITRIPHRAFYDACMARMSKEDIDAIKAELNERIESDEVHTAGWMPGSDWTDTVFQPIYTDGCRNDPQRAGLLFGLIVWVVMMEHPQRWGFGRYDKDGIPIRSLTYFKLQS
jgi:hypothetical protein